MDWTKKVGRKQVGRKLGVRFLKDRRLMIRHEFYKNNNYISVNLIYSKTIIHEVNINLLVSRWMKFGISCRQLFRWEIVVE